MDKFGERKNTQMDMLKNEYIKGSCIICGENEKYVEMVQICYEEK